MRKYLIACYNQRGPSNPVGGGIDPILDFIDSREDVFTDWQLLFGQIILVISDADVQRITKLIRRKFPHTLLLVIEILGAYQGWLPPEAWEFLNRN